jgi:hypothetical protein
MNGKPSSMRARREEPSRRRAKRAFLLVSAVCAAAFATSDRAPSPELFREGVAALARGAHDEAIDDFELLADRGFVHPDASYDRGVAYARRALSGSHTGDLGRAAAAFSETLLLRPADESAGAALDAVRAEIGRRRAREGATLVNERKSVSRALVDLLAEDTWAIGAAVASALLTISLAAWLLVQRAALRLAATTSACVAAALLVIFGGFTARARYYRHTSEPAVVVSSEARLLDETGAPLARNGRAPDVLAIPEGERVDILERRATLVKVEWGTSEGWVTSGQLRTLAHP